MRIEKRIGKKKIWVRFVDIFLIKINSKIIKFSLDYEILRDIYDPLTFLIVLFFFFLTAVKNLSPSLISRETILSSFFRRKWKIYYRRISLKRLPIRFFLALLSRYYSLFDNLFYNCEKKELFVLNYD